MFGLIPLETLPGWPEAPNPSALEALAIFIGAPAAIFAVLVLLIIGPSWFGGARAAATPDNPDSTNASKL